jgi:hypothetical protein
MKYVICINNIGNYEKYKRIRDLSIPSDIDAYLFVDKISQEIKKVFEKMKWKVVILNCSIFPDSEFVDKFRIMKNYYYYYYFSTTSKVLVTILLK